MGRKINKQGFVCSKRTTHVNEIVQRETVEDKNI